jgi:hypothetical protein
MLLSQLKLFIWQRCSHARSLLPRPKLQFEQTCQDWSKLAQVLFSVLNLSRDQVICPPGWLKKTVKPRWRSGVPDKNAKKPISLYFTFMFDVDDCYSTQIIV